MFIYLLSYIKQELLTSSDESLIVIPSAMVTQILSVITHSNKHGSSTSPSTAVIDREKTSSDFQLLLTRKVFDQLVQPVVENASEVLQHAIHSLIGQNQSPTTTITNSNTSNSPSNIKTSQSNNIIDEIVLVGGSSRVPCIQTAILNTLSKENIHNFHLIKPSIDTATTTTTTTKLATTHHHDDQEEEEEEEPPTTAVEDVKELCTAINPDLAVVQGLAIRGAVLMGYDVGVMKDILMLDILPTSIGVLSWPSSTSTDHTNSSNSNRNRNNNTEIRLFEPIVHSGSRIPITNSKLFQIEDDKNGKQLKFLSLDIYEEEPLEIDDNNNTNSGSSNDTSDSSNSKIVVITKNKIETSIISDDKKYKYKLMGTYDVLIPPLPLISDSTNNNNIDMNHVLVHFTLDIQGALTFHVTRPMLISDKEGTNEIITNTNNYNHISITEKKTIKGKSSKINDADKDNWLVYVLIGYIVLMFVMYVFVKMYFSDLLTPSSSSLSSSKTTAQPPTDGTEL